MKITHKGDYALKAILDLAVNYGSGIVTINEMAKRIDAPIKFLEQVLLSLKKGAFVESKRGKVGGYMLSREPEKITVGEVIRCIDGPIEPISCLAKGYTGCDDMYKCVFRQIWQSVAKAESGIIDNVNFKELAYEAGSGQKTLAYSI